jgi:hypothetical protein
MFVVVLKLFIFVDIKSFNCFLLEICKIYKYQFVSLPHLFENIAMFKTWHVEKATNNSNWIKILNI